MLTSSNLSKLIGKQAAKYGDRDALVYKDFGGKEWKSVGWTEFAKATRDVSRSLLSLGISPGDRIGIFSQNAVQYFFTDFGAWGIRAVTVPFYATSSEQQIQFMVNDSRLRLLFVGEKEQYVKALRVFHLCPTLEHIIIFDERVKVENQGRHTIHFADFINLGRGSDQDEEIERIVADGKGDDLACILYTSGTTGDSKGVMLSHGQFSAALEANAKVIGISDKDRVLDFLPFAHVFEKGWAILSLSVGATMIVNTYPNEVLRTMNETNPTSMSAVPRFWEKVYMAVMYRIEKAGSIQKALFLNALSVGKRHNIDYLSKGLKPPIPLHIEYEIINRTIFSLVRNFLGIPHPNIFPTAGATVSEYVEEFVHSIGLGMVVGYGLTESMATVSIDVAGKPYTIGSVGRPLDVVDVKISDEGEILIKGPTITKGYYNRPDLTAESLTADGYFRTGDSGFIRNGELFLTERIKDLFKTSNGKYIAPQMIESKLLVDKFIDQIAIIADGKPFVSALIVPDFTSLEEYCQSQGLEFSDRQEMCQDPRIKGMIMGRISTLQQQLAGYEQVKRIELLPRPFSIDKGELTDTLKLRRRIVCDNFKKEIEHMYLDNIL